MTIEESYNYLQFLVNSKQSGKLTPDSFNLLCNVVNMEYFNYESGLTADYLPGQPYSKLGWQITAKITDNNRHLVVETDVPKVGLYFPYPTDYGAFSSLRFSYTYNPPNCADAIARSTKTEFVTDGELAIRLDNPIIFPTLELSIAAYYQQGIRPYPKEVDLLHITYLRKPVPAFRNYTVTNNQDIYNPTNSLQWDWPETVHPELIARMVKKIGVNLREENLFQMMSQYVKDQQ